MADMHNESLLHCYLRQLSVEKLMELLRQGHDKTLGELEEQHYEIIEEVILEKEAENSSGKFRDVDTAWEDFVENYKKPLDEETDTSLEDIYPDLDIILNKPSRFNTPKTFHRRKLAKIFVLAATIAVLIISLAVFSGAQRTIFSRIATWTQSLFSFSEQTNASTQSAYTKDLAQALTEAKIDSALAPAWLPENYSLESIQTADTDKFVLVHAIFRNNSNSLGVQYYRYTSETALENLAVEKDSENATIYESNNRAFYLFTNLDTTTATWSDGMNVIVIYGPLSITETEKIIDSIGE